MSFTSSLLLFLLYISLHACNARLLGAIGSDPEKKLLIPNKSDEKVDLVKSSVTPKLKPHLSKEVEGANTGDTLVKQSRFNKEDDHKKPISLEGKGPKGKSVAEETNVDERSSLNSVSNWRVPRKKRGEKQPGFNLDYSPPKTHPPVHN